MRARGQAGRDPRGREPASEHYKCDVRALCAVERIERVLREPRSCSLCVPHLGADEFDGYARLLERYDNLWLDTTMVVADYFAARPWSSSRCDPSA